MTNELLNSFVQDIITGNNADAKDKFNTLLSSRVSDALDVRKVEVANSVFNQDEQEEE